MAGTLRAGNAAALQAGLRGALCIMLVSALAGSGCRSLVPAGTSPTPAETVPVETVAPIDASAVAAPVPGTVLPAAPDTVETEPAPVEHCREACTFAVLGADTATSAAIARFSAAWGAVQALAPEHTVILGNVGLTRDGLFAGHGRVLPIGPGAEAASTVVFPGGGAALAHDRLQSPCERAVLLFLAGRAVTHDEAAQVQWLQECLSAVPAGQPVLLFLDQPIWERSPAAWGCLQGVLESSGGEVHVVAAGTARFSWWRDGGIQFHTIGSGTAPGAATLAAADGGFSGLIWISVGPGETMVRVVEPTALLPAEVLSRRLQEQRQALRDACQAGPVLAADGLTEVRCSNPTDTALAFEASWHFRGGDGRVEPQMLGFSLEPGQSFRQRFRLQADRGIPLKFAVPRLVLTTVCRDGLGQPVQVQLDLVPPVRMAGQVAPLSDLFMVDGSLGDWPGGGNPINHASQVVLALQPWRGPTEFSGSLYVGEQGSRLCFAIDVRREKDVSLGCLLLVDPRGMEGGAYEGAQGPLAVTVAPDGQVAIEAPRPAEVTAVWRPTAEGGVLEAAFDRHLFAAGSFPEAILADVVLTRFGENGEAVTALCFSGDARGRESSTVYGRFLRSPLPGASGAAAGSAGGSP